MNYAEITDYKELIESYGGMLCKGSYNNNRKCCPYFVIIRYDVPSKYKGFIVRGLGEKAKENENTFSCHRNGAFWNVSKEFYNEYKNLFDLVDKLSKEFTKTFQAIQTLNH